MTRSSSHDRESDNYFFALLFGFLTNMRRGGGFAADKNGIFTQQKNLDDKTKSIESLKMSKKMGTAVGLIIGLPSFTVLF